MTGESRCQYATTSRQSEYTGTTYVMISIPAVVGARWRGRRRNKECLSEVPHRSVWWRNCNIHTVIPLIPSDENDYRSFVLIFPRLLVRTILFRIFVLVHVPGQSWLRGIFKGGWRVDPLVSVLSWLMASVMGGIWFAWMLELNGLPIF